MTIDVSLGGHLRHSVPAAAEIIQSLRTRHSLTVAQALNCLKINSHENELLVTVDGVNIPPEKRKQQMISAGQIVKITPWYGHLHLCGTFQTTAK